ncbi:structural constituent of cuticle [Sarcoptes scabiei]|nr:structural constituent of cuticle [Sarcoptes scabiei]
MSKSKQTKNGKLDLSTRNSIFTTIDLSQFLNKSAFANLPDYCKYHLIKLLPNKDQIISSNNVTSASENAFANEYFSRAIKSFSERLKGGKLTNQYLKRLKKRKQKQKLRLDPLKLKYFEPYFVNPEKDIKIPFDKANSVQHRKNAQRSIQNGEMKILLECYQRLRRTFGDKPCERNTALLLQQKSHLKSAKYFYRSRLKQKSQDSSQSRNSDLDLKNDGTDLTICTIHNQTDDANDIEPIPSNDLFDESLMPNEAESKLHGTSYPKTVSDLFEIITDVENDTIPILNSNDYLCNENSFLLSKGSQNDVRVSPRKASVISKSFDGEKFSTLSVDNFENSNVPITRNELSSTNSDLTTKPIRVPVVVFDDKQSGSERPKIFLIKKLESPETATANSIPINVLIEPNKLPQIFEAKNQEDSKFDFVHNPSVFPVLDQTKSIHQTKLTSSDSSENTSTLVHSSFVNNNVVKTKYETGTQVTKRNSRRTKASIIPTKNGSSDVVDMNAIKSRKTVIKKNYKTETVCKPKNQFTEHPPNRNDSQPKVVRFHVMIQGNEDPQFIQNFTFDNNQCMMKTIDGRYLPSEQSKRTISDCKTTRKKKLNYVANKSQSQRKDKKSSSKIQSSIDRNILSPNDFPHKNAEIEESKSCLSDLEMNKYPPSNSGISTTINVPSSISSSKRNDDSLSTKDKVVATSAFAPAQNFISTLPKDDSADQQIQIIGMQKLDLNTFQTPSDWFNIDVTDLKMIDIEKNPMLSQLEMHQSIILGENDLNHSNVSVDDDSHYPQFQMLANTDEVSDSIIDRLLSSSTSNSSQGTRTTIYNNDKIYDLSGNVRRQAAPKGLFQAQEMMTFVTKNTEHENNRDMSMPNQRFYLMSDEATIVGSNNNWNQQQHQQEDIQNSSQVSLVCFNHDRSQEEEKLFLKNQSNYIRNNHHIVQLSTASIENVINSEATASLDNLANTEDENSWVWKSFSDI